MRNVADSSDLVHLNAYEHKMSQDSNKIHFAIPYLYQSYTSKKPKSILFVIGIKFENMPRGQCW